MSSSEALTPKIWLYMKQASIDNEKLRKRVEQLEATGSSSPQKSAGPTDGAFRALSSRLKALEDGFKGQRELSSSTDGRVWGLEDRIKQLENAVKMTAAVPSQMTVLRSEMANLDSRLRPLDDEVAEQALVVSALKHDVKMLDDRTLAQEEGSSTLSDRLYEVEVARNDWSKRLQYLETSHKTLKGALVTLRGVSDQVDARVTAIDDQLASDTKRFEAVDRDRDDLTRKLDQTLDDYERTIESELQTTRKWNMNLQQGYREVMDLLEAQVEAAGSDLEADVHLDPRNELNMQRQLEEQSQPKRHSQLTRRGYSETQGDHATTPDYDTHQNLERQLDDQIGSLIPGDSQAIEEHARTQSQITLESQPLNTQLSQPLFTQDVVRRKSDLPLPRELQPNNQTIRREEHYQNVLRPDKSSYGPGGQSAMSKERRVEVHPERLQQERHVDPDAPTQYNHSQRQILTPGVVAAQPDQRGTEPSEEPFTTRSHGVGLSRRFILDTARNPMERLAPFDESMPKNTKVPRVMVPGPPAPNHSLISSNSVFPSRNKHKTQLPAKPKARQSTNLGKSEADIETQSPSPPPPLRGEKQADTLDKAEADDETQTPTPTPPVRKSGRPPKASISAKESRALQSPIFLFGDDPRKVFEGPRRETRKQAQDSQRQTRQSQSQQDSPKPKPVLKGKGADAHRCSTGGVRFTHGKKGGSQKRSPDESMGPPAKKRR